MYRYPDAVAKVKAAIERLEVAHAKAVTTERVTAMALRAEQRKLRWHDTLGQAKEPDPWQHYWESGALAVVSFGDVEPPINPFDNGGAV